MGARVRILGREKGALARIMLPGGDAALIGEKDLNLIQVKLKAGKLRKKIMKTARQFLGDKYYWGGRSGYGVDCSGLVNISYRVWGLELPRNAAQQCDYGRPVTRRNFKPADLIFSTKRDHPERINHVMLYAGGEKLLEATQDSGSVREVTFKKKFGQELAKTKDGQMVGDRRIFFRTVLG
jgi:cell wall-associated NlpC family hydrolase